MQPEQPNPEDRSARSAAEPITELDANLNRSGISEDIDNQYYVEMLSEVAAESPADPAP